MNKNVVCFIIGLLSAIALTVGCSLLFAVIVKCFNLSGNVITIVNQVIKGICILFGVIVGVLNRGVLFGGLLGLLYGVITKVLFGLLSNNLVFNLTFVWDMLLCIALGSLFGIIVSNVKKV